MRSGFIIPIIFFLILASGSYYLFNRYSQSPNILTQDTAESTYEYPNSTSWELKPSHNICLMPGSTCIQPVKITFTSNDSWATVYNFYKKYLSENGWATNSTIYTSVPSNIVFASNSCTLTLEPKKGFFLSDNTPKGPPFEYTFTTTCSTP